MLEGMFILPKFMAASRGGAISKVLSVETKGNFCSQTYVGAK